MSESTHAAAVLDARFGVAGLEAELARRHELVRADLAELGADALIATREGVVTYLTGYTSRTWSNFSRPIVVVVFADGRLATLSADTEAQAIEVRVPGVVAYPYGGLQPAEEHMPDGAFQFAPACVRALDKLLGDAGVGTLAVDGLDAVHPPISQLTDGLVDWRGTLVDASARLWHHRLHKSEWEVGQLTHAARVLEAAFDLLPERLEPGMTERELHAQLAAASFECGADELGYTNVVTVGAGREIFGAPTDKRWEKGEVLYVDGGVIVNGYWADFCRQYTVGEPTPTQAEGFARVVHARDVALESFRGGMAAGELGKVIERATDTPASQHQAGRYGHGIGLYMPEPPSIAGIDDTPLDEGVAFCLEPAVMHDRTHYVVEEEYVVRDGQLAEITVPSPRELIAL